LEFCLIISVIRAVTDLITNIIIITQIMAATEHQRKRLLLR
jgi:hypothetical protein